MHINADADAIRILLVEDDPGDAYLVETYLEDAGSYELTWVTSIGELAQLQASFDCVLLDLGLPDANGLEALHKLRAVVPAAVVVLTGRSDESMAIDAVAAGAEEYLLKAHLDSQILQRSIRFAIERRRADDAELRAAHTARMAQGLFARPLVTDSRVSWTGRYQPGGAGALLGGDFIDMVEADDGWLHLIIGDVAGHGPDEAAIGVSLRMSWRALALAGHEPSDTLHHLDGLLRREWEHTMFATACQVSIAPDRRRARVILAGHPPPLLVHPRVEELPVSKRGLPLGISSSARWEAEEVELGDHWSFLVYTDGLVEGRIGAGPERWGIEGLIETVGQTDLADPESFLDELLVRAATMHGADLPDDVAVLLIQGAS
ncbi:MAG TPA: SpoIIE family protein phosphatase [Acidimicrobiales bacterium]|nr:SpoIIE family protein phosphatase [Acidimicrobiales bacterium]